MTSSCSSTIKIDNYLIGTDHPVFIIAEIGVNHNGDVDLAIEMIHEAASCGANCVKFQTFKAERVVMESAPKADYQLKVTDASESQIDMLRKLELPISAYEKIIECCNKENIVFMSTPYNVEDVDYLEELNVSAYKLASIHAAEPYFAQYVAHRGKPVILSTGMANISEIQTTLDSFLATGNKDVILLQCTTNYPSALSDANLKTITTMSEQFNVQVGYSDHTDGNTTSIAAVALGATVIEKHFTVDKSLPGPDQTTSANVEEFRNLVNAIRDTELALGSGIKEPCVIEKKNAIGMRRSIVAKTDITAGDKISFDNITFKRPASGILPAKINQVIGMHARENIKADTLLDFDKLTSEKQK